MQTKWLGKNPKIELTLKFLWHTTLALIVVWTGYFIFGYTSYFGKYNYNPREQKRAIFLQGQKLGAGQSASQIVQVIL